MRKFREKIREAIRRVPDAAPFTRPRCNNPPRGAHLQRKSPYENFCDERAREKISVSPARTLYAWHFAAFFGSHSSMSFARFGLFFLGLICAGLAPLMAVPPADPAERLKELVATQKAIFEKAEAAGDRVDEDALRTELQQLANDYDKLIRAHQDFAPAYVAYGLMLGKAGMRKESVTMLLRANQLDKDIPIVKNQLGNYLAEEGKPLEALSYFMAAIKLEPEEPLYHYQLGMLLYEAREDFLKSAEWSRAAIDDTMQKAFLRAMELAPDDWRYSYQYGLSFYELEKGDWETALTFWQNFEKKLRPGVEQEVCRLHQAKVLHELQRTDEARRLLAQVNDPALSRQKNKIADTLDQPPASQNPSASESASSSDTVK